MSMPAGGGLDPALSRLLAVFLALLALVPLWLALSLAGTAIETRALKQAFEGAGPARLAVVKAIRAEELKLGSTRQTRYVPEVELVLDGQARRYVVRRLPSIAEAEQAAWLGRSIEVLHAPGVTGWVIPPAALADLPDGSELLGMLIGSLGMFGVCAYLARRSWSGKLTKPGA